MQQPPSSCPLCHHAHSEHYFADTRNYWQCNNCRLVFVDASEHLNDADEKERYDLHENNPDDAGYRAFLNRLVKPLSERLLPNAQGLDFGCGPGPTVSVMLEELGYRVTCYDKFYADTPSLLTQPYDFITATEVLEHLREPAMELDRLISMLQPSGYLGVMTKLVLPPVSRFATWHYKNDLTHICFYSEGTFEWVAARWGLSLEIIASDVVFLRRGN